MWHLFSVENWARRFKLRKLSTFKNDWATKLVSSYIYAKEKAFLPEDAVTVLRKGITSHLLFFKAAVSIVSHLFLSKAAVSRTFHLVLFKAAVTIASVIFPPPMICPFRVVRFLDKLKVRRPTLLHNRLAHLLTSMHLQVVSMAPHKRRLLQTQVRLPWNSLWKLESRDVIGRGKVIQNPPLNCPDDLIVMCRDFRHFRHRITGQLITSSEPQNVHFHLRLAFVRTRYPHFFAYNSSIYVPPDFLNRFQVKHLGR